VRLAGLESHPQRLARAEQVALADHLVDRARAQPLGERHGGHVAAIPAALVGGRAG